MNIPQICRNLEGRLIVSCQASAGDPFCAPDLLAKFAVAAELGGAAGIRADSPENIRAIRSSVSLPVVGIHKSIHRDGAVLITPSFESAAELTRAGADIIALDCSVRGQRYGAFERLRRIRSELHVPVFADVATIDEGIAAAAAGADAVLSTLRGYTPETECVNAFEPEFIRELVHAVPVPVIAEGKIDNRDQARLAIANGAFAVVIGTVITRPREITRTFARAVEDEFSHSHAGSSAIAVDLGGTNTKFGLVSQKGDLMFGRSVPTPADAGRNTLLAHLIEVARDALTTSNQLGYKPAGIGIATAGWIDTTSGTVAYATENLPGWTGTPIAHEVASALHTQVAVENDANASATAEKYFGVAKNLRNFVCITLGTGVGGGCYIGGRLNRGAHFFANAIGHMTLEPNGEPCTCGKRGCLEVYTNARALLRYANDEFSDSRQLIAAANSGNPPAIAAIQKLATRLAHGCASIIQLLDPEALILSGGLTEDNPVLLSTLQRELAALVPVWAMRKILIRPSPLGYYSGVLGAAAVFFDNIKAAASA
ncbi:MAG: putative N-acetylmannosamine-6-phosphate 2-epimerase [Acidobacteriaceae bacterium]|nr:putative N-acetylmannosamine-6-phosphate 2-epimerase [Acidobacteriaceae bacterium]